MANCKEVRINAIVPFHWLQTRSYDGEDVLSAEDVAFVASFLLSPVADLTYHYEDVGYGPKNEHGGRTALYLMELRGVSGAAWLALDRLAWCIARVGKIEFAAAIDIEDTSVAQEWGELSPEAYDAWLRENASAREVTDASKGVKA